ncbi:type I restriction enzyme HsdR N-terminal domain-containing protein [Brevibacterium sp. p3-SID960]|uniref:type I restriction endonuclease n=1 Tax=Brevibacterium sp. p3-SID960 TaxID=2916063 RepID=UPI0021A6AAC4|nr:type I restriction endonuclease [Brevibacterium sp. p3-SID960]MCT1690381.1 type I restriction enzyme HsdR N-terminal domain-containing protein [Brevibacterium sp. p3-SID960]
MSEVEEQLRILARKLSKIRPSVLTEEATKTALIMPFIQDVLGFDVFNVDEVIPEFVADVGLKKGEKIDFAIVKNDEVAILIECKKLIEPLSLENASQLYRYFNVTTARIAVLTNGNEYRFYTDLDEPNRMDAKPFLEFTVEDVDRVAVHELEKLSKQNFDLESVLSAAEELKYVSAAKRVFAAEAKEISYDMATLVLNRIYSGRITQRVREELTPLVAKGLSRFIGDQVNNRLSAALGSNETEEAPVEETEEAPPTDAGDDGIETTDDEQHGYYIVQAILSSEIAVERVHMRDAKSYCAIIFDDNNRKPICRLRFNNPERLRVGLMNGDKTEEVVDIDRPSDLYAHAERLRETARRYV